MMYTLFDDILIEAGGLCIRIAEGDGMNMPDDGDETGIVDYLMYTVYACLEDVAADKELDGGQIDTKERIQSRGSLEEWVPDVLSFVFLTEDEVPWTKVELPEAA